MLNSKPEKLMTETSDHQKFKFDESFPAVLKKEHLTPPDNFVAAVMGDQIIFSVGNPQNVLDLMDRSNLTEGEPTVEFLEKLQKLIDGATDFWAMA